jgi:hypothetical protein
MGPTSLPAPHAPALVPVELGDRLSRGGSGQTGRMIPCGIWPGWFRHCCHCLPFLSLTVRWLRRTGVPRPASSCRRGGPVRRWFRPESLSPRLAVPRLLPALPVRTFIPLCRSTAFLSSFRAALKRSTDFAPLTASAVRWAAPKSVPSVFSDTAAGIAAGILRFLFILFFFSFFNIQFILFFFFFFLTCYFFIFFFVFFFFFFCFLLFGCLFLFFGVFFFFYFLGV